MERIDILGCELKLRGNPVPGAQILVHADSRIVVVYLLRGVPVERARVDIGAVRQLRRIGGEKAGYDCPCRGIRRQRCPLVCLGDQDIAVDAAAHFLLARIDKYTRSCPQGTPDRESIIIVPRGLDVADLKERARAEDAVEMGGIDCAVSSSLERRRHLEGLRRGVPELRAEIVVPRRELADDGGGGTEPHVQLLERVVVDQIELDVFVAPALAGVGVRLPQQIQLDALVRIGRLEVFFLLFLRGESRFFCRLRRSLSCTRDKQKYQQSKSHKNRITSTTPTTVHRLSQCTTKILCVPLRLRVLAVKKRSAFTAKTQRLEESPLQIAFCVWLL